jgi:single-strand DNA-binding protein
MYNKAIVMGRLTADPELRQTTTGTSVTSFSIAVNRQFVSRQTGERQVDFLDIVAWRQTAEFVCRYFTKGRPILIEGSIQTRNYTDKNGQNRRAWEIIADSAHFADARPNDGGGGGGMPDSRPMPQEGHQQMAPAPAYASGNIDDFAEIDDDGDLPF